MIRSLRTGVTGLRANQLRLDVIGNNISGVNTTGFKRSRVLFQDALTQRIATGGRLAGPNPAGVSNVGNGVSAAAVDQVWSQGTLEYTNLPTDLALAGDGFFIAKGLQGNALTRAGAFAFDADGYLVTPGGLRVQGWEAADDGTVSTGALQNVRIDPSVTSDPVQTTGLAINGNLSAERPVGSEVTMTSVVYDGTGVSHTVVLTATRQADPDATSTAWSLTSAGIVDADGTTRDLPGITGADLVFDTNGQLTAGGAYDVAAVFPDGASLAVDMSALTQFGGSTTAVVASQTGSPAGDLVDYNFDQEGRLILSFSNGVRRTEAQLALGNVTNPDGLDQVGDGFYAPTVVSGDLQIGRGGSEIDASVISGALESSNVDLAEEFTDMIVAQRGYQANARVITTSDELLQETVQLKR